MERLGEEHAQPLCSCTPSQPAGQPASATAPRHAQDGVSLGDVVLPPWANGSPEEFVRVMREALESELVSQVGRAACWRWRAALPGPAQHGGMFSPHPAMSRPVSCEALQLCLPVAKHAEGEDGPASQPANTVSQPSASPSPNPLTHLPIHPPTYKPGWELPAPPSTRSALQGRGVPAIACLG